MITELSRVVRRCLKRVDTLRGIYENAPSDHNRKKLAMESMITSMLQNLHRKTIRHATRSKRL